MTEIEGATNVTSWLDKEKQINQSMSQPVIDGIGALYPVTENIPKTLSTTEISETSYTEIPRNVITSQDIGLSNQTISTTDITTSQETWLKDLFVGFIAGLILMEFFK